MASLLKEVQDVKRLEEIALILIEEGFELLIDEAKLRHYLKLKKSPEKSKRKIKPEARLRKLFERLGPTFIKLGQVLSLRPDLIPQSYAKELEKLLDEVPPFPFKDVKSAIEKGIGKPINQVFKELQKKPIASASVSQVHIAELGSGEKVVVKVQRPEIKKLMEKDIDIMLYIAGLLERHSQRLRKFRPVSIVQEFKMWTEKELDFRLEARNAIRFYHNFRNKKTVKIPKVYDNLVAEKVLVLEYIEGTEITKLDKLAGKVNIDKIIKNGLDAVLTMVFVHGLFHADPHPANILVTKDEKIAFVDFGIVGFFDERLKSKSIDLLYGIVDYDADAIVDTIMSMGMDTGSVDVENFRADVASIIEPLRYSSLKDIKISYVLEEIISIPLKHNFRIPPQFILFGKAIVTLEGVALEHDPDFNIVEATKPFLEDLLRKRASPSYLLRGFVHNFNRYRRFADEFPEKAEVVLDKLAKGNFKIDVKDEEIGKLAYEIDKGSNRLAYSMIIAALLLTSSITLTLGKGPQFMDVPAISALSFSAAIIFGFILFVSILKEKHRVFKWE